VLLVFASCCTGGRTARVVCGSVRESGVFCCNEYFKIPEVDRLIGEKIREKQETKEQEKVERAINKRFIQLDESYKTTKLPKQPKN